MGNLWSRGAARSHLMGHEKTSNPTPAAVALLGKKKTARVKAALARRIRKSAHRGNPLPAVVGILGSLGGLGGRFKSPSEKRAAGAAGTMVNAAVNGNLTAAKAIAERTEIGIQKERAVWRKALAQIPPQIIALVKKYLDKIPGVDHSTPESAAETALSRAIDGHALEEAAVGAQKEAAAARTAAAREVTARGERREALFAGVAGQIGQGLLSRGRSLRRPTRRRRSY